MEVILGEDVGAEETGNENFGESKILAFSSKMGHLFIQGQESGCQMHTKFSQRTCPFVHACDLNGD